MQRSHSWQRTQQVAVVVGVDCGEVLSFFQRNCLMLGDVVVAAAVAVVEEAAATAATAAAVMVMLIAVVAAVAV
jgi:hypothetical protein